MRDSADDITLFLKGNGAVLLDVPSDRLPASQVSAKIPAELLDKLAADRWVMAVDMYGKNLRISDNVRLGDSHKLGCCR